MVTSTRSVAGSLGERRVYTPWLCGPGRVRQALARWVTPNCSQRNSWEPVPLHTCNALLPIGCLHFAGKHFSNGKQQRYLHLQKRKGEWLFVTPLSSECSRWSVSGSDTRLLSTRNSGPSAGPALLGGALSSLPTHGSLWGGAVIALCSVPCLHPSTQCD